MCTNERYDSKLTNVLVCSSLELLLSLDHSLDASVHVLDQLHLGSPQSPLAGDVVDLIKVGVLPMDAADLHVVCICQ